LKISYYSTNQSIQVKPLTNMTKLQENIMTSLRKLGLAMVAAIGLSACTAPFQGHNEVEMLNKATAVGSAFTQQLASEYRTFSNYELKTMQDYADALHFARKGLAAAEGVRVMPEPISDWDLLPNHMLELADARARLISAFDRGAREIVPQRVAVAQARFDCWIEQQEENWQTGEIISCRDQFFAAMNEVEASLPMAAPEPAFIPAPVAEPTPPAVMDIREAMYIVFFDFDKSNVNQGGQSVLDAVINEVSSRPVNGIVITGHTDTSGSRAYNERLAIRRAENIKRALVSRGLDAGMISTQARGEGELLVPTADGVREPANRRGTITFR
jgi:OOP family OmpA-OmpF porin